MKRPPAKPRRRATNTRGRKPPEHEVKKMTKLGYVTVAEAAKAVNRAASSIYNRLERVRDGKTTIPSVDATKKSIVTTASGNVWLHLASIEALYDAAALTSPAAP